MRLIDADDLLEKYETYGNTSPIALTFIDDLNEMPTVKAIKIDRLIEIMVDYFGCPMRCAPEIAIECETDKYQEDCWEEFFKQCAEVTE